jgi:hypothetical protein
MTEAENPIAKRLNEPIPPLLWHYTSMSGCHGIIKSKAIFATDARFLNDHLELKLLRQIAEKIAQEVAADDALDQISRKIYSDYFAVAFETGVLAADRLRLFVASFSAVKDSLPQWRGYSYESCGVSLGFDLSALRPPSTVDTLVQFARCIYSTEEKETLVRHAVRPLQIVYEKYVEEGHAMVAALQKAGKLPLDQTARAQAISQVLDSLRLTDRLRAAHAQIMKDFVSIIALFKDESFAEENEWRLILPVQSIRTDLVNPPMHRVRGDSLVPTIVYPLCPAGTDLPLREVIIGPGAHQNADGAMNSFLQGEQLMVRAQHSKVPYRPTGK